MKELHINGLFHTIQGEGGNAGRRALFVRMPYCNLSCSWCDTQFNSFKKWEEKEFIKFTSFEPTRFAVITGGEPMMHKHTRRVVDILGSLGFTTACETNGVFPIVPNIDYVTVSPKEQSNFEVHSDAWEKASEFKYVVDDRFDFKLLNRHNTNDMRRYSLSPEFGGFEVNIKRIIEYVAKNPAWRISLQTHKWIKVP